MSQPLINITRQQALIFALFLVMYEFLTYIANDLIMPGMIHVVEAFHGEESDIALSLSMYILGGASLQIFLGPISDRFGRRPVMLTGVVLFFIFTVLIGCSFSMPQFLLARFFQGMGLCFISVIGYATLQEIFEEMDAIRLIALMANVSISAPLLGPLAGALFVSYWSWRFIFFIIAALTLMVLIGLWCYMPESVGQMKRDGQMIQRSKLSFHVVGKNYWALLCNPVFMLAAVAFGLTGLPCVIWIALAPVIMVKVAHLSLVDYGIWQLPVFSATIMGNIILHRLTHHVSLKSMLTLASLIISAGLVVVFLLPFYYGNNYLALMPGLIIYFFGLGLIGAPLSRLILFSTHVSKGTASALMSLVLMVVQAIGIPIANAVYVPHLNVNLGTYCFVIGVVYNILLVGALFCAKKQWPQEKQTS
jgi:DHA1 family multidrug/chloramphenicol efflux transport protein-like MFS transporter